MTLVILWWFVSAHKWFKGPLVIPFFFFFFFSLFRISHVLHKWFYSLPGLESKSLTMLSQLPIISIKSNANSSPRGFSVINVEHHMLGRGEGVVNGVETSDSDSPAYSKKAELDGEVLPTTEVR
jgi:hypothetical protein